MKALGIIFTCIFLTGLIGFVITASVTGFNPRDSYEDRNWSSYNINKTFDDVYSDIDIDIVAAKAKIKVSSDGITRVDYVHKNSNIEFVAEVRNDTLIIKERQKRNWWSGNMRTAELYIEIPEAVYNKIDIDTVSGGIDGILPEAKSLVVNSVSGTITLDCNGVEKYSLEAVSGTLNFSGLSGSGSVNLVSGKARLDFAEWNGSLKIDIVSGSTDVTVPAGSGANIDFSKVSGSMSFNMDGNSAKLTKGTSNFSVGGENKQNVRVDLVSGNANLNTR